MPYRAIAGLVLFLCASSARVWSQAPLAVTSPLAHFGANVGDDYFLATYSQFEAYWRTLDAESDRLTLVDIGRTEEGRTQWMAVMSSPENLAQLDRYRDIARRLALAEDLAADDARALAREGRAIVWIDGGQHSTEVLAAQQLIELSYQLVTATDEETQRILDDVIVLAVHANPDGHALVADWYMRERDPQLRTLAALPRLYQKYVGHDNNRDFFLSSQAETINLNRVLHREWFPQVVYTHHQAAPPGTVMFTPPFEGPFSPFVDPLVAAGVRRFGDAMQRRLAAEGKRGVTTRGGGEYSSWWNGSLRTTAYFHNQIGLLTETIGEPWPTLIPAIAARQRPSPDLPLPIAPQTWRIRRSVEYSMTANRAVLEAASRQREAVLFDAYRMGRNAIERGGHAYVLPADQPDFLTAVKFADALLKSGVSVHRTATALEAGGRTYPAGSFVVKAGQAFGAHVLDMFEPQTYPAASMTTAPYDVTGWTLAFQMGVKFDRLPLSAVGPLESVEAATPPQGSITGPPEPAGYFLSHHVNDAFVVVNRLLRAGNDVYWLRDRTVGSSAGTGVIYVPIGPAVQGVIEDAARQLGVTATGVAAAPAGRTMKLGEPRVGLWDRQGGSVTSGWTRWLLERYEFPFERVYAPTLDQEGLRARYDVLIFTDDAVPSASGTGEITVERTLPRLREFLAGGGTVMLIGDATAMAGALGVPVSRAPRANARLLTREMFSVPGSVLRVSIDNTVPLGFGFERQVDVFFADSPVFALTGSPSASRAQRVAWFSGPTPLRSGWARGQRYLDGTLAVIDAPVGLGRVLLFGPEIAFRAQSHGTFKFLFNGIHLSAARD